MQNSAVLKEARAQVEIGFDKLEIRVGTRKSFDEKR